MKKRIDVPDKMLREITRHTGAKSRRGAVVTAVGEFNRRRRLEALAERLDGSCPDFMSQEVLQQLRRDHKAEAAR